MQNMINFLVSALMATSAVAVPAMYIDHADGTRSELSARNSYALGVNIFNEANCGGPIANVRNHDVNSCQYASRASGSDNWISIAGKTDGADGGHGCMTVFSDSGCTTGSQVYQLNGNGECLNFNYPLGCVVVAELGSGGTCDINPPTC